MTPGQDERALSEAIHDLRNHLAVAIANVEAFTEGILEPTPARLRAVLQALSEVDVLVRTLPIRRDDTPRE